MVIGKLLGLATNKAFAGVGIENDENLIHQLTKFWQVEEKSGPASKLTEKELQCERFYEKTTTSLNEILETGPRLQDDLFTRNMRDI